MLKQSSESSPLTLFPHSCDQSGPRRPAHQPRGGGPTGGGHAHLSAQSHRPAACSPDDRISAAVLPAGKTDSRPRWAGTRPTVHVSLNQTSG